MNEAWVPTPAAEPVTDELVFGDAPANPDNLSTTDRQTTSTTREPTIFMSR